MDLNMWLLVHVCIHVALYAQHSLMRISHSIRIWNRNILCSPLFLFASLSHSHFLFLYPFILYFICCHVFSHKRTNTSILIIVLYKYAGWDFSDYDRYKTESSFSIVLYFLWENIRLYSNFFPKICCDCIWRYSMLPYKCERIRYISYILDIKIIAASSRCIHLENKWHTFACWFKIKLISFTFNAYKRVALFITK